MLQAGNRFPDFSLVNQDNKSVSLGDFAGHWLVVYFYPKDDTPGCTIQGKAFSASKKDFDEAGIKIVGVSADDATSHKNFCARFSLTIDLLADTDSTLMKKLGIGQSEWKGLKFWDRTTFVVDPSGIIRKAYEKVNPEGHEQLLLNDIRALQQTSSPAL
jgi:peroxiredoxin Q/BCP